MGKTDWDIVTNYTDAVTTALKTVTFPKVQEQVYLRNQGNANVTYTIGSQSGTLTPGQSVTVNQDISSFTLQAVSGTHTFEVRAKEKGTEKTEDSSTDVMSLLAEITTHGLSKSIYNLNALKNIRKPNITAVYFGDSIASGTGSSSGAYGFLQMFTNTAMSLQNGFNFKGNFNIFSYFTGKSWDTPTPNGIGSSLYSSNDSSQPVYESGGQQYNTPTFAHKFHVIYSKRPDGGNCEIKYGTTVVGTINCNGTSQDGLLASFDIPANQAGFINPLVGNKAYINGFYIEKTGATGAKIQGFSAGGTKSSDYSQSVLESAIKILPNDLLIWEFLANDWSQGAYDGYVDRTNFIVDKAKSLNMDVIITITCGQQGTENNALWKQFRDFIYTTAKTKECCVIDYDAYFGGYTEAKANGLISDTVHPTDKGHILMADVLCQVVFGINCLEYVNKQIPTDDFRNPVYGYVRQNNTQNIADVIFDQARVKTGNYWEVQNYGYLSTIHRISSGVYPSLGKVGLMVTETVNNQALVKKEDNTWTNIMANPILPQITSLPTASDNNIGKVYLYNGQVVVYMPDRTWKALSLTTVV